MILLIGLTLVPAAADAQAPVVDPIRELLVEVRALRIAMERSATVGARIQLLVARVQLQEQRIAELSRRSAAVRDEISKVEATIATNTDALKREESAVERTNSVEMRRELEQQVEHYKAQLRNPEKRRQELLNEESLLSQQLAADQGRWSDVNNQLDELERSLTLPIKQ
jgi:chromosome segregation ATPase